jgi:hypothetical protein
VFRALRARCARRDPSASGAPPRFAESEERTRGRAGTGTWADFYVLAMAAPGLGWTTVVELATDHDPRRKRYSQHRQVGADTDGSLAAALCAWLVAEESPLVLAEALRAGVKSEDLMAYVNDEPGFRDTFSFMMGLAGPGR